MGFAAVGLDVPAGTPLGGYAARTGPSTGVLDALEVAAVSVQAGTERLIWIVADLPCVNVDLVAAVREIVGVLDIGGHVWVSATHTHAGPETGCAPGGSVTPEPWLERVTEAATEAATRAVAAERASTVELRRVRLSGVGGQRSGARPRRTVPVDVLSVQVEGRTAGVVAVLPVHPTVLDAGNRQVSADLTGATRHALTAALPGAWAVVATGAAGDVSTRPHRKEQTARECARLGALAAATIAGALRRPPDLEVAAGELHVGSSSIALEPKPAEAAPLDELRAALAATERVGDPVAVRTAYTALQAAELAESAELVPAELSCAVAAASLGPLRLLALGAEPYLELSERAAPAVLLGYTNGYVGYLPTRAAYRRPDYEVLRTPVAAGGAELALAAAADLIEPERNP
ncbi:hypothetical protein [Pseudonocardia sp. TRM90224]|uniref:hypothetical protein n=1 Tax=Pseudonocardia sp. TRM90224 TaxID=2812678 RepID=UPI001E2CA5A9|nr:hypothetical protein [Pseudonocardia sp. TRM90224]